MLEDNKAYASKKLCLPGFELPLTIIQGDARNLSELLKERGMVAVSSPPYGSGGLRSEDSQESFVERLGRIKAIGSKWTRPRPTGNFAQEGYGSTPGQIGALPDKPIVGITSPPYFQGSKMPENATPTVRTRGRDFAYNDYGDNPDNIGNLPDKPIAITSPPYTDTEKRDRGKEASHASEAAYPRGDRNISQGIRGSEGNISNLPDKLIAITSPPWNLQSGGRGEASRQSTPDEGLIDRHSGGIKGGSGDSPGNIGALPDKPFTAITSPPYEDSSMETGEDGFRPPHDSTGFTKQGYGQSEGQIGQEQGQTYLEAMKIVYAEIAKSADVLVVVTKDPTKKGKLRELCKDTQALLEATGWRIVCHHHSILFEEQEMGHLFEGQVKKPRGRLSFFKRLSYRKGSPVAMWEDCLFCVKDKPEGMGAPLPMRL